LFTEVAAVLSRALIPPSHLLYLLNYAAVDPHGRCLQEQLRRMGVGPRRRRQVLPPEAQARDPNCSHLLQHPQQVIKRPAVVVAVAVRISFVSASTLKKPSD
jgi:hypothetical protein